MLRAPLCSAAACLSLQLPGAIPSVSQSLDSVYGPLDLDMHTLASMSVASIAPPHAVLLEMGGQHAQVCAVWGWWRWGSLKRQVKQGGWRDLQVSRGPVRTLGRGRSSVHPGEAARSCWVWWMEQ